MTFDARDNAPTSGTTSRSEPTSPSRADRSEAAYLAAQADDAKAAMHRAWSDIAAGLQQGVNPAEWTRDYPWIALVTASAAGFVAGTALVPSKRQQMLRQLAELERALHPPPPTPPPTTATSDNVPRSRLWFDLAGQLFRIAAPILGRAVSAALAAERRPQADNNGDSVPRDPPTGPTAQADPDIS